MTFALILTGTILILYSWRMIRAWQFAEVAMESSDPQDHLCTETEAEAQTSPVVPELTAIHRSIGEQLVDLDQQRIHLERMVVQLKQDRQDAKGHPGGQIPSPDAVTEKLKWARLHNDVCLLYDQGMTVTDIARLMCKGKGEVQLILDLRTGLVQ